MIVVWVFIVISIIAFIQMGIFIGREFGTFQKFLIWILAYKITGKYILPPYEDVELPPERLEILKYL